MLPFILGGLAIAGLSAVNNIRQQHKARDEINHTNQENFQIYQQNKQLVTEESFRNLDLQRLEEDRKIQQDGAAMRQSKLLLRHKQQDAKGQIKTGMRAGTSMDYRAMMLAIDEQAEKELLHLENIFDQKKHQKRLRMRHYVSTAINRINAVRPPQEIRTPEIDYIGPILSFGASAINTYTQNLQLQKVTPEKIKQDNKKS